MSQSVTIIMDMLPTQITPHPEGVPHSKLRVVVTTDALVILWQAANKVVGRLDIPMTAEETSTVSFRGGQAGPYKLESAGGCGCGMNALKQYVPFPGASISTEPRADTSHGEIYGVPSPTRWNRVRR